MEKNEFDKLSDRLKRIETKQTHMMEVLGINTQNNQKTDINHPLISIRKHNDLTVISLLHKEVSILELQQFLKNHIGSIIIVCGDELLWTIAK